MGVTVGDSGLCCPVRVTSFESQLTPLFVACAGSSESSQIRISFELEVRENTFFILLF